MRKQLLVGGAWALGGKVVAVLGALLVNMLLTRLLSPKDMGVYFLSFSMASIATFVAQLGMPQTAVRLVAKYAGMGNMAMVRQVVNRMLVYVLISAAAITALLVAGGGDWVANRLMHSRQFGDVVFLAALWIVPMVIQVLYGEIFRGLSDIRLAVMFAGNNTGGGALSVMLLVIVLYLTWVLSGHLDVKSALLISLGCASAGAIAALIIAQLTINVPASGDIQDENLLVGGGQILLINLASLVISQSDVWFVGAYHSVSQVSYYAAAAKLALLVPFPLLVVNGVISPMISNLYYQGKRIELERLLRHSAWLSAIPAIGVLVVYIAFGREILGIFFGDQYREGAVVLMILSAGMVVNVLTGSCGMMLIMTGHSRPMMWIVLVSAFLVLGMLELSASRHIEWVALSIALGQSLHSVGTWLYARRKIGIWTHVGHVRVA